MAETPRFKGIPGQGPRINNISADELRRLFEAPEIQKPGLTTSDAIGLTNALETRRMNDLQQKQKVAEIERKIAEAEAEKAQNEQLAQSISAQAKQPDQQLVQDLTRSGLAKEALGIARPGDAVKEASVQQTGITTQIDGVPHMVLMQGKEAVYVPIGGTLINKTPKRVPDAQLNSLATLSGLIERTEAMKSQAMSGEFSGFLDVVKNGISTFTGVNLNPKTTIGEKRDFYQTLQTDINLMIKEITGAQLSNAEAKRISKQLPQKWESDESFQAGFNSFLKEITDTMNRKTAIMKAAGIENADQLTAYGLSLADVDTATGQIKGLPQSAKSKPKSTGGGLNVDQNAIQAELKRRGLLK